MAPDEPPGDPPGPVRLAVPPETPRRSRLPQGPGSTAYTASLCAVIGAGIAVFGAVANEHYPLRHWLFFMFVQRWLLTSLFVAASLSTGLRVSRWLVPEPLPPGENLTLSFALGVLVFALGVFLGGLAGVIGSIFFYAWPIGMLAFGAPQAWRAFQPTWRSLWIRPFYIPTPRTVPQILAALFLALGLVAVYLQVMTPLNVGGDSYWYHLPIAEHYASSGKIRPFAEGWYLGAYPHLASLLYTWAFMSPGVLFDHVTLSSHLEWALFLATLGGVAALTRRLLGGVRVPFAGVAVFLFPGIFLHDSSLITGADHVLAFWAPPLGIALVRMVNAFDAREARLVGIFMGAAILTKYQASYFFVPTAMLVLYLSVRRRRLLPALVFAAACLTVSSAHWLKNWIAYGDPFYPLLHRYLPVHPFHEGAGDRMYWDAQFLLTGTPWEKVQKTVVAVVTFAFIPHNWEGLHGHRPVFGSLFTLLIPVMLFLRDMRRTWLLVLAVHLGVVVWFVTSHQDRYLQALLPWMAAATAAILFVAWQKGAAVRAALGLLVALQVVWGADVYFIRSHVMIGDSPLKALVDYMALGHQGRYPDQRRLHSGSLQRVGARLPAHAKVLVHEKHDRLGLGAASISDTLCWQGAVDYMVLDTPDAAAGLWRQMGATHAMWWDDVGLPGNDYMAREAVFARTVDQWGDDFQSIDDKRLSKLNATPRDATRSSQPTTIAWLGCGGDPPLALYSVRGLVKRAPQSPLAREAVRDAPLGAIAPANAVILRASCDFLRKAVADLPGQFKRISGAGGLAVWVRR